MNLLSLIKEYVDKKKLNDKIQLLAQIESEKTEKFNNTFPINYNSNLELFFYSLYEMIYIQILSFFKNNTPIENEVATNIIGPTIEKSKLLFYNEKENSETIKELDKQLRYIPFICGSFNGYMYNQGTDYTDIGVRPCLLIKA